MCPSGLLDDHQLFEAFNNTSGTVIMTVSRAAVQRVNNMVVNSLLSGQALLMQAACASVAAGPDVFPCHGMKIVITENRDKGWRVVNGQDATLVSNQSNTLKRFFQTTRQHSSIP